MCNLQGINGYDKSNPKHFWIGFDKRNTRRRAGEPILTLNKVYKTEALREFKKSLWQMMRGEQETAVTQWLRSLPDDAQFFGGPHAKIILEAARWVKTQPVRVAKPEEAHTPKDDPGAERLWFGQWKGLTLRDISIVDPTYLDWLLGQEWVYPKTQEAIVRYFDFCPSLVKKIRDTYEDEDYQLGGKLTYTTERESSRFSKDFSHGKPTWLPTQFSRPDVGRWIRSEKTMKDHRLHNHTDPEAYGDVQDYTDAGPQDEERDWREPRLSQFSAWKLFLDLSEQVERAEHREEVPLLVSEELEAQKHLLKRLSGFVPQEALQQVREAYRRLPEDEDDWTLWKLQG